MAPVAENETTKSVEQTVPAEEKKQVESTAESSEKNTTSSAVPETESSAVDVVAEAQEKLNAGKRNLACDEFPQAVESLADACQLLAEKYGEEGNDLAESYFYYGRALLELARMENGVLGNALDGVAAEEENEADLSESEQFEKASEVKEDEREEIIDKVYTAMSAEEKAAKDETADKAAGDSKDSAKDDEQMDSEATSDKTEEPEKSESTARSESADKSESTEKTDTSEKSGSAEKTESAEKSESTDNKTEEESKTETTEKMDDTPAAEGGEEEGSADEDGEEGSADDGASSSQDEGEDADDIPNLQLSWEVLELSKKIYNKQVESADATEADKKAYKLKLSEVYRVLGEVSLETGAYEQAIQDMNSCLEIQVACMEADSRFIAETHYQLGNAHLLNKSYKTAVEELRKAKSVIESRISNLEKKLEGDEKEKSQKELDELRQLLPDVVAKVEDVEDESRSAEKAEQALKNAMAKTGETTIGFGDSASADATAATTISTIQTKKANDISNLVRKRKPEEQDTEDAKKAKSDVQPTTEGKENGVAPTQNGTAKEVLTNGNQ